MKNITALALAALTAGSAYAQTAGATSTTSTPSSDISVAGKFGWSAKNVYLGKERSSDAGLIQSTVTVESGVPGFAGVNAYVSYYNADNFERSLFIGAKTEWTNVGTVEFGVSRSNTVGKPFTGATNHATLVNEGFTMADRSRQVYAGLKFSKLALTPSAYLYYDTDLKQTNFVVSGGKDFEGKDLGVPGFDLETKAYLGLVDSKTTSYDNKNSYVYLGASADVIRRIGTGAKVGLGVSWAYNTDGQVNTSGSSAWLRAYANFKF